MGHRGLSHGQGPDEQLVVGRLSGLCGWAHVASCSRSPFSSITNRTSVGCEWRPARRRSGRLSKSPEMPRSISLARGFMRDEPLLLILDEPTAALDAETEHALFERYAAAARGNRENDSWRITILVSHRFSTVRMADLILVLDGARLVEVGTHDELMARKGHYSELYSIQAAAYR